MIQALTNEGIAVKSRRVDTPPYRPGLAELAKRAQAAAQQVNASYRGFLPGIAVSGAIFIALGSVVNHHMDPLPLHHSFAPITMKVVVGRGGSLWQIARQYGDPNVGIQEKVNALAEYNGLHAGAPLIAGQTLMVPVSNPTELARRQVVLASR